MSKKSKPMTEGLTWLELSFSSFNGSGYRNSQSPEKFVDSYIQYKLWRKQPEAAKLARTYYKALLPLAEHLMNTSSGATKFTSLKNRQKFQAFRDSLDNRQTLL